MKSEEVEELVGQIERQQKGLVKKENIFEHPVRLYLTIKTMYQNYKKNHELEIMQARIFDIAPSSRTLQPLPSTPVSAACLFEYHRMSENDMLLLIEMKDYLAEDSRQQLYQELLTGIDRQVRVGEYMKCYRTLLNYEFVNQNMVLYDLIEEKMISKLLTLTAIPGRDIALISHHLSGLPTIKQPIRILISHLYERVAHIRDFRSLYLIFEATFPDNPDVLDIEALFRICLPQTLAKIKELFESREELRGTLMEVAEGVTREKLRGMALVKTSKTLDTLNLVVEAVKLGIPIWQEIIEWEHKATQEPKNMLKDSLEGILVAMLKQFRCFATVVAIIERITDIDEHSEIGLIFVRELLKLESRQYLSHRVIRRFLAIKILKYNSSEDYSRLIFNRNFKFIEVLLEMLNYRSNAISFYQQILSSDSHFHLFQAFLAHLAHQMPLKFQQFCIRVIEADADKHELFPNPSAPMLKLLAEQLPAEVASTLAKDLSVLAPSKSLLIILGKLLGLFKEKALSTLKASIVRSLKIMLVRAQKGEINKTFQIQFPSFIKEHLIKESNDIFVNVPEEIKEELKKTYENYLLRKKTL